MTDQISLKPWTGDDMPVLERSNTPEMTTFLGGPETGEQLLKRQANFLRLWEDGEARMFTVNAASEEIPVGSVGYWKTKWADAEVYEAGWSVATAYQGRGFASMALAACLQHAATYGDREQVVAFPRIDNRASNSLCKSVGFCFRGEEDFEYPKGNPIRVNAWLYDLSSLRIGRADVSIVR
ncbi:GNAT family N-acetyltransferase [Saxibacter everestensis]|uniref:GNAT family N-acetyltransferase n=1 Tax=Saxibacter everestensis TaxID=2909229 RepID=A0ABY8QZE9_9MICO|nr:GNAT family N-acetyltransferase [Brevibacteriaceae bacterium ZFBP1038]